MSFNATRLTCFAIISAIETDCREALLAIDADEPLTWPQAAEAVARARIERDRIAPGYGVEVLVQYLDFADAYQVLLANKDLVSSKILGSLDSVKPHLEGIIAVRNRVAHSRPMEIGDLSLTSDIATELIRSSPYSWPATSATLANLRKDPSFVLGLTVHLPIDPVQQPQHNLPIPDYDETGFFGRSNEFKRIKKALLGPYPVVSVIGDGGIGKTAIALKVAYDLLGTENSPFDAIVWVSAKATTLTNNEIRSINGAIQDSLGIFEAAARELNGGVETGHDPIVDLLEYLEQFHILLILDNLETVTDQRLRDFLLDLPLGSKVLLTSRIGLGIENPVKLEPLTTDESKRLLRSLASIRSVKVLKDLDDEAVTRIVAKLRGHPLYIKWLVAGVQSGRRPTELVNDNSLLLDYCMSNVWDKLTSKARGVLQAMQIARGPRSLGELAYLSGLTADVMQAAVLELMTTNFVAMRHSAGENLDGAFETGEFASQYLARHQPPTPALRSQVAQRARELEDVGRDLMSVNRAELSDPFTIDVRDRSDVPTARLLIAALKELRNQNYDLALQHCAEAQALSPTYGEVWRVQGLTNYYREDLNTALADFRRAREYADSSSAMAVHVGNFLLGPANAPEEALELFSEAARANPADPSLLRGIAEANFHLGKYQDAVAACSVLAKLPQSTVTTIDNALLCLRAAVFGGETFLWKGQVGATAELFEETMVTLERLSISDLDERVSDWMNHLASLCVRLQSDAAPNEYLARRAGEYRVDLQAKVRAIDPSAISRTSGQLRQMDAVKRFGFISSKGKDFFFHRNDLLVREEWQSLEVNCLLAFEGESHPKGLRAVRVRALS